MPHITTDDGVRLHYLVDDFREPWLGEPDAAVLLHHGFVKNLAHWTPFVSPVARRRRVVRYDVRGAGDSAVPPESAEWSVDRLVKDALNLIDALGIRKVHWAGFESGGVVGMFFAAQHSERTASLACFNMPFRDSISKNAMGNAFNAGYANPSEAIDGLGIETWIGRLMDLGILVDRDDPAVVDWVARQALRVSAPVAKAWHRIFWEASSRVAELPGRIAAPVLLLAGAKHVHGCQPPLLDKLRRQLKNAREVVYIPGVAIGVQLLEPEACAAAYLDFLNGVDADS